MQELERKMFTYFVKEAIMTEKKVTDRKSIGSKSNKSSSIVASLSSQILSQST